MLKHALNISYYYSDFASIQVYTLAAKMDLKFDFFSKKKKKIQTPGHFPARESHIKIQISKPPTVTWR